MEDLKKIADSLMEKEGRVKGEAMKADLEYIRLREGEKGVEMIEKKLEELGYSFRENLIEPLSWYKEGQSVLLVLLTKELFNWNEEDVFEMGKYAAKGSLLFKILVKYFSSPEKIVKEAPKYWTKYFDFGALKVEEFNKEENFLKLKVEGYHFHPIMCNYLSGVFQALFSLCIKSKEVRVEEEKCTFSGDEVHQFKLSW